MPLQRQYLEQGMAPTGVKAAAWRALEAEGVPMGELLEIATKYLEHRRAKRQSTTRTGL